MPGSEICLVRTASLLHVHGAPLLQQYTCNKKVQAKQARPGGKQGD